MSELITYDTVTKYILMWPFGRSEQHLNTLYRDTLQLPSPTCTCQKHKRRRLHHNAPHTFLAPWTLEYLYIGHKSSVDSLHQINTTRSPYTVLVYQLSWINRHHKYYIIQMTRSRATFKYNEPEVENDTCGHSPSETFSTEGNTTYLNVA